MKSKLGSVICSFSFLFAGGAHAQLPIDVHHAEYSTDLHLDISNTNPSDPRIIESRTTVSDAPIYDSLAIGPLAAPPYSHEGFAEARSSVFEVYSYALAINGGGHGYATNRLRFSPLQDSLQTPLDVQISPTGRRFSLGSASLFDLTANSPLWEYDWSGLDFDPLTFHANTDFVASHQYELTLWTRSGAQDDASGASVQLFGLVLVPEPSTTALLAVGTVLLIYRRRRR